MVHLTEWVHFRVETRLLRTLQRAARADGRTLSQWVRITLENAAVRLLAGEQSPHIKPLEEEVLQP